MLRVIFLLPHKCGLEVGGGEGRVGIEIQSDKDTCDN